jgi:hypothetical protein
LYVETASVIWEQFVTNKYCVSKMKLCLSGLSSSEIGVDEFELLARMHIDIIHLHLPVQMTVNHSQFRMIIFKTCRNLNAKSLKSNSTLLNKSFWILVFFC